MSKEEAKEREEKNPDLTMDIEPEVTNSGRPKRKSFMDAQVKLPASKVQVRGKC